MKNSSLRARFAVGSSALVVALILGVFVNEMLFRYGWASAKLEEIEPRYARLKGLAGVSEAISSARDASTGNLAKFTWPADASPDRIGTDLQQRVRALAESAGLGVTNSQILPVRPGAGFELIPLSVSLEGGDEGVRNLLLALPAEQPAIQIESLVIQGGRKKSNNQPSVTIQITVGALRLLP